jgi:DNA primase
MDEFEIIVETITEFLGQPKKIYKNHLQVSWNCPECDEDRNKGNLEVSIDKHIYHCWSCNISGPLGKLFDEYGNKKQKKTYRIFRPEESKPINIHKEKVKLPENFIFFKDSPKIYPIRKQAYNYLKNRGITDEMIDKYKIGFCDSGTFAGRIIIPSYDKNGELNYFIARSWDSKSKMKYKNPKSEKDKIIFNEYLIDWNKDITLVEGVFDSVFVPNSIPLLGKHISDLLLNTIYSKTKGNVIICLDSDAWDKSVELYNELNGGELWGRVRLIKLPNGKDIADLRGKIESEYFFNVS